MNQVKPYPGQQFPNETAKDIRIRALEKGVRINILENTKYWPESWKKELGNMLIRWAKVYLLSDFSTPPPPTVDGEKESE